MSSTSACLVANPATVAPVATAPNEPSVASSETPTDGQASFARIMSDATADNAPDTSSSSSPRVPGGRNEKDGKREDDKAQAQVAAQIAATLVPAPAPPPLPIIPTANTAGADATSGGAPAIAVTTQPNRVAIGNILEQGSIPTGKATASDLRGLANTKETTVQHLADDSQPPLMTAQKTQLTITNGQLPIAESSPPPATNPTSVENAAPLAGAVVAGTAIAKQVGRMKMQEKTENNSEVAEKNLPPTSFVAQIGVTSDGSKPRAIPTNLPQHEGRSSANTEVSSPILAGIVQGKAQPADNHTVVDAVRSAQTDKVFTEISERVMSFKRMGADSAEVNLRPDSSTEITLSLNLRNGQVEMTARLERGNLSALNSHWTGLQQSLSQQGVRVGQLTSSQSAMNDQFSSGTSQQGLGENTSRSFERGSESFDDLSVASANTESSKGGPQKAVAATGRGWEMWA